MAQLNQWLEQFQKWNAIIMYCTTCTTTQLMNHWTPCFACFVHILYYNRFEEKKQPICPWWVVGHRPGMLNHVLYLCFSIQSLMTLFTAEEFWNLRLPRLGVQNHVRSSPKKAGLYCEFILSLGWIRLFGSQVLEGSLPSGSWRKQSDWLHDMGDYTILCSTDCTEITMIHNESTMKHLWTT